MLGTQAREFASHPNPNEAYFVHNGVTLVLCLHFNAKNDFYILLFAYVISCCDLAHHMIGMSCVSFESVSFQTM